MSAVRVFLFGCTLYWNNMKALMHFIYQMDVRSGILDEII